MAKCATCGNEYDGGMEITVRGLTKTFDCFECAIHAMAPRCGHCGCPIIGHGVEAAGKVFCCASCARLSGIDGLQDHANHLLRV